MQQMKGHKDNITDIKNIDDQQIISGSEDGTLKLWNLSSGLVIKNYDIFFTNEEN